MRRICVLLFVLAVAAGCGGGDDDEITITRGPPVQMYKECGYKWPLAGDTPYWSCAWVGQCSSDDICAGWQNAPCTPGASTCQAAR